MAANVAVISAPAEETPSLVTRNRILAFVNDDLSAAALRTGLEGTNLTIKRGTIRNAVRILESDTEMSAVVADVSGIDDPIAALEDLARVCPPDVLVALIGDNNDMAFYRTVVNGMGATEYLSKPLTRDSVQLILRPKLAGGARAEPIDRGGHVVSLCGAQGGAGVTSIAVNLALQLAETTKAKVALLDLHLQGGETAVMLGLRPGPGLRIALEDPMRADTLFIERAAIDVNDRVKLIAADEPLDAELQITEAGVRHVLGLLRQRFNFIVADVPVPLVPAIHPVIGVSRHVLVLLEAEVTGLRNTHALRAAVTGIAGKNRVFTVLNRANRPGGLPTATIVKGLGAAPDMVIPDLGKGMMQAINSGVPALKQVSGLRRHLAPIVQEIAGVRADRRGWLSRWFRR
jgi:pilus assembly protein CpaE